MDILKNLQETEERFNGLKGSLDQYEQQSKAVAESANKEIASIQNHMADVSDEMKRVQGEYRTWVKLGQEAGLLDEAGKVVTLPEVLDQAAQIAETGTPLQAVPAPHAQG